MVRYDSEVSPVEKSKIDHYLTTTKHEPRVCLLAWNV